MSCPSCNTVCNCAPLACATEPLVPVCNDAEYCAEIITDKCVIHKGATLSNIGAVDTTRLDVILTNINTALGEEPNVTAAQLITIVNSSVTLRNLIRTVAASSAE